MATGKLMTFRRVFWWVVWLSLNIGTVAHAAGWDLPVKLGDSKSEVYAILGSPSRKPIDDNSIDWFPNSGLVIQYDPTGRVSKVIIHGQYNPRFITYREPVIYGLKVTDTLDKWFAVLGHPVSAEDD